MRTKTIPFILLLLISLMVKSQTKISGIKFGLNLWVTDYKNAPFWSDYHFSKPHSVDNVKA
jgi:hypothetical protein